MARGAPDYAASRIPARARLGYDDVIQLYTAAIALGIADLISFGPVPANKIWNITNALAWNDDGITDRIMMATYPPAGMRHVVIDNDVPAGHGVYMTGEVWIEAGNIFRIYFIDATAGDNLYATLHGTQIDVEL